LLGDVRGLKWPDVKHTNPPDNKYKNTAAFKDVDVYIKRTEIPVDKLWKAIVCFRQPSLVQGKGCRGSASGKGNGKHLKEFNWDELYGTHLKEFNWDEL